MVKNSHSNVSTCHDRFESGFTPKQCKNNRGITSNVLSQGSQERNQEFSFAFQHTYLLYSLTIGMLIGMLWSNKERDEERLRYPFMSLLSFPWFERHENRSNVCFVFTWNTSEYFWGYSVLNPSCSWLLSSVLYLKQGIPCLVLALTVSSWSSHSLIHSRDTHLRVFWKECFTFLFSWLDVSDPITCSTLFEQTHEISPQSLLPHLFYLIIIIPFDVKHTIEKETSMLWQKQEQWHSFKKNIP